MELYQLKIIAGVALLLIFIGAVFALATLRKRRMLKSLYSLRCNIYLKRGGKRVITKDIRLDSFTEETKDDSGKKTKKLYFIIKEAIQEEVERRLFGTRIIKFMDFDEGVAYPFVMSLIGGTFEKKYLGSERAHQLYRQKIWDEIGGIGESKLDAKTIGTIAVIVVVIIIAFLFLRK